MSLKELFVGDIYGQSGRDILKKNIKTLKKNHNIDLTIVNGENITHGKGISKRHYDELMSIGVDAITLGNHYFKQKDICEWIDSVDNIIRPANLDYDSCGTGSMVIKTNKGPVRISNILGRIFMNGHKLKSPFDTLENIVNKSKEKIHIVDFHAEATSEKKSLAYYFSKRVSAVVGTHTHIQTADERILNDYTAYISDVGFCGAYDSVLGINIEGAIDYSWHGYTQDSSPAKGRGELNAVIMEFEEENGRAIKIERINIRPS